MDKQILLNAEERFLTYYPKAFLSDSMLELEEKHQLQKTIDLAKTIFSEDVFDDIDNVLHASKKLIQKSAYISSHEKTKFNTFLKRLHETEEEEFSDGLYKLLYGSQKKGFIQVTTLLEKYKLNKWTIISAFLFYTSPEKEIFMKPTTVKKILSTLKITDIEYAAAPTFRFYKAYREKIDEMKSLVDPVLYPNNALFSLFLLMMFTQ